MYYCSDAFSLTCCFRVSQGFAAPGTAGDSAAEHGLLSHAAPRLRPALGVLRPPGCSNSTSLNVAPAFPGRRPRCRLWRRPVRCGFAEASQAATGLPVQGATAAPAGLSRSPRVSRAVCAGADALPLLNRVLKLRRAPAQPQLPTRCRCAAVPQGIFCRLLQTCFSQTRAASGCAAARRLDRPEVGKLGEPSSSKPH